MYTYTYTYTFVYIYIYIYTKEHGLDNNISWEIHKKTSPYQCG